MSYLENIISIIAITLIAIFCPDWWKLLAFLPMVYMNSPASKGSK